MIDCKTKLKLVFCVINNFTEIFKRLNPSGRRIVQCKNLSIPILSKVVKS